MAEELKVKCLFDHIITTMNTKKTTEHGIILKANEQGEILTRQTVLAAGPNACVVPGEEIEINVSKFPIRRKHPKNGIGPDIEEVIPPIEIIDKKEYLFISSREVKYIYIK